MIYRLDRPSACQLTAQGHRKLCRFELCGVRSGPVNPMMKRANAPLKPVVARMVLRAQVPLWGAMLLALVSFSAGCNRGNRPTPTELGDRPLVPPVSPARPRVLTVFFPLLLRLSPLAEATAQPRSALR